MIVIGHASLRSSRPGRSDHISEELDADMTGAFQSEGGAWEPVRAETNKGSRVAGARVREGESSVQPTEPRLPRAVPRSTIETIVVGVHVCGRLRLIG